MERIEQFDLNELKHEIYGWQVKAPSDNIRAQIKRNWDAMAKPLDSMGVFEDMVARIGAILGTEKPDISRRALIIMCADNGVVEEGISQSGQEVTAIVTRDMGIGRSNVCHMAKAVGCDTIPVDIGINSDEVFDGVLDKKVRKGTRNFAIEPAMSEAEMYQAICTGMEIVRECKEKGYTMLATGEMSIGNTTTSSAIAAGLLGLDACAVVGRGAGLSDEGLLKKRKVVQEAYDRYKLYDFIAPEVLRCVGGLDIAGLVGVYLGGCRYEIPVVVDGAISLVAAYVAEQLRPGAKDYMIASHKSREPLCEMLLEELGLNACIDAGMALGEGTGAVMLLGILDTVMALYDNNRSFEDISMKPYERFGK